MCGSVLGRRDRRRKAQEQAPAPPHTLLPEPIRSLGFAAYRLVSLRLSGRFPVWLFGGVFRVLQRHPDRYEVELTDEGAGFIGRLKLRSPYRERATRVKFENHYVSLNVEEVLREPYSGRSFPGFEDIDLSFEELETLVRNSRPDWKAALASVKGVYLISDIKTGKRYVGSAYGDQGIWSRWCDYVATGHGGNVD